MKNKIHQTMSLSDPLKNSLPVLHPSSSKSIRAFIRKSLFFVAGDKFFRPKANVVPIGACAL
jgi:hypothetical protein